MSRLQTFEQNCKPREKANVARLQCCCFGGRECIDDERGFIEVPPLYRWLQVSACKLFDRVAITLFSSGPFISRALMLEAQSRHVTGLAAEHHPSGKDTSNRIGFLKRFPVRDVSVTDDIGPTRIVFIHALGCLHWKRLTW